MVLIGGCTEATLRLNVGDHRPIASRELIHSSDLNTCLLLNDVVLSNREQSSKKQICAETYLILYLESRDPRHKYLTSNTIGDDEIRSNQISRREEIEEVRRFCRVPEKKNRELGRRE